MSRPVTASHVFDFAEVLAGWHKISVTAGPSGDLVMLALQQKPDYRKNGGTTSKSFVNKPNQFRIHHLHDGKWSSSDLQETLQNMSYAQPLSQSRWILVRARSGGNTDGNGHIYAAQGNLLETVALGDGIQDVQTTIKGHLWVSYFDEGVFGDTSLGNSGLACLNEDGTLAFDFNKLTQGMIADCYALNVVSDSETWLCPYTDFPIVRLRDRQIDHSWDNNPIHGSGAFAVWKDRVLFSGGYSEKNKLFIVNLYRLDSGELLKEECHAVDESGSEIKFTGVFGRGSRLYLATEQSLYFLELQEI